MVVVGCTQGQACAPVVTLPIAYHSEARCLAERAGIIAAIGDLGYDRLVADCRKRPVENRTSAPKESVGQKPLA